MTVTTKPTPWGDAVRVELPATALPVEAIQAALDRLPRRADEVPPAGPLRHVRQGTRNCAVAAAATIAGVDYNTAAAALGLTEAQEGLSLGQIRRALSVLTGERWAVVRALPCRVDELAT